MTLLITSHKQLDALVAEHCAGWTKHIFNEKHNGDWDISNNQMIWGPYKYLGWTPPFSRSADAVLPLLEARGIWQAGQSDRDAGGRWVNLGGYHDSIAPTFPLAACLALLRARGHQVELSPDFK